MIDTLRNWLTRPPTASEQASALAKRGATIRREQSHALIMAVKDKLDREYAAGITAPLRDRPVGRKERRG